MITVFVLSVAGAILLSALCSLLEAALYSLPPSHIELLARNEDRAAPRLRRLKEDIDEPITAILTLNTIANTMGAAVSGAAAAAIFGEHNLIWFSILFTLAVLFFSEILPKTIGIAYTRGLARFIVMPIELMIFTLKPMITLCRMVTRLIPQEENSDRISSEELQAIAGISRRSGEIEAEQEKVIINILQLGDKTVRQVMTPRTVTFSLPAAMTVGQAITHREQWDMHTRVPLYGDSIDDVVGIALCKDVFMAATEGRLATPLAELKHSVYFVPEIAPLNQIMLEFFNRRKHLFVVVDEYGSVTGVVSLEDILEEVIGREIVDESDKAHDMRELARHRIWRRRSKRIATGG